MIEVNLGDKFVSGDNEWTVWDRQDSEDCGGTIWHLRLDDQNAMQCFTEDLEYWVWLGTAEHVPAKPKPSSQTLCTCTHSFLVAGCTCGAFEAERV